MPDAGDVIWIDFPGAMATKRRPAVVLSSDEYHATRPDMIIGLVTSQIIKAGRVTAHLLSDWSSAGLRKPSAFRTFLATLPRSAVAATIGRLSASDWQAVQKCVKRAIAV